MSLAEDIKRKIDIVDVISEYVHLEKAGQNFKALCPFHNEKHPSFFVFPEQQTWHCFGACGTGGDVFSFIMKKEGAEFGQSLRILAERAGISLSSQGPTRVAENEAQQRLFHVTDAAAEYYHHILTNTATGKVA
ncbi:MAG: CHC2 zinc finger domain-containing protein, partial [Chloroflexota bacterium]|nr:CHC2 zinc finger domain-containing protein [Chloroflexota bacterium]